MARPYRLKFEHACYLVTLNGVEGLGLFVEKSDAGHFVSLLDLIARKHQILLHAYGLAENRAAMVVETPRANLSLFLQGIQTAFARHIRRYYVQSGPIMKDRYRAKVIEKTTVLAPACEWVHALPFLESGKRLSPSAAEKRLRSYTFSSYRYTAGLSDQGITRPGELLRAYGSPAKKRPEKHAAACENLMVNGSGEWDSLAKKSTVAIGSGDFVKEMEKKHRSLLSGKRVPGVRVHGKKTKGVSRSKVLTQVAEEFQADKQDFFVQRHGSVLRPVISSFLYQYASMTQKEIADFLKLGSAAAVSLQIKQLLTLRQKDADLDKKCRKLEKSFARAG